MPTFLVALLLYLFPMDVIAKFVVILFEKLAKATEWTQVDDELAAVMKEKFSGESDAPR